MNHALSRLKKASHASSLQPASGVDGDGNVLPAYARGNASSSSASSHAGSQQSLSMAEKTLPPGAAAYPHPTTQWDQAQRERDELERAMKLSEEQEQASIYTYYFLI